ncbi:MFS transporter [Treponema sp.]|uniref:MFS transporter n=1 Tax=Treponema sp. TaxID=166 RepID=UPI00298E6808|nr:MFS transporter [Treponema sp.]
MENLKSITKGKMWCYALGQLGWSMLSGLIGSWLVYFYQPAKTEIDAGMTLFIPQGTVVFGVLTIIGLITAAGRIFDAITDPLIGSLSDNCRSKLGRRIPFLKFSALPLAIVTLLVFCAPVRTVSQINTVWLCVFVTLYYFLITCYCTPYTSLIAELAHTQEEKLQISTCISLTFIVGTAIAYVAPVIWNIFMSSFGMERINAMRLTFGIISGISIVFLFIPVFTINEKDYVNIVPSKTNMFSSLLKTFKNHDFKIFVIQDLVYWFALTLFQTGLAFFVTQLFKLPEEFATYMFVGLTAVSLLFYPVVNLMARKIGKKACVFVAFMAFCLTFFLTGLAGDFLVVKPEVQAVIVVVLGAFPMAIFGILPQAMVADIAQCETVETGENRSGMFFAARTFAFKFGQSVAMLTFTSLATLGYRLVAITASIFCLIGGFCLLRYNEKRILEKIENDN